MDTTRKLKDEVYTALRDCGNDCERAVWKGLGTGERETSVKKKKCQPSAMKVYSLPNNKDGYQENFDREGPCTRSGGPPRKRGRGSLEYRGWQGRENKEIAKNLEEGRDGLRCGGVMNGPLGGRLGPPTFQNRDKGGFSLSTGNTPSVEEDLDGEPSQIMQHEEQTKLPPKRAKKAQDEEMERMPCVKKEKVEEKNEDGDAGIIESIYMKDFMDHASLRISLNRNINIVFGSGKSAILAALGVALGSGAVTTNTDFVKVGSASATVQVTLCNKGSMAYRPVVYGAKITVSRTIEASTASCSSEILAETGKVISTKLDELHKILEHFNIQINNPASILNRDTSRTFLNSHDPKAMYEIFMKAIGSESQSRRLQCDMKSQGVDDCFVQRVMVLRVKHLFRFFLEECGYTGIVKFKHKAKTLEVKAWKKRKVMSAGERSFSTLAFLMALWGCVHSPFYFLDQFDVLMDESNQQVAMDLLLCQAQMKKQCIFLTDQELAVSYFGEDITIH